MGIRCEKVTRERLLLLTCHDATDTLRDIMSEAARPATNRGGIPQIRRHETSHVGLKILLPALHGYLTNWYAEPCQRDLGVSWP